MLPLEYIGAVLNRAAQGSINLTDRLSVLIVPFATLVFWGLGAKMTSSVSETLAIGVAMTVIAVVLMRLLAATYLIWRDDQVAHAALANRLEEETTRLDRSERETARHHAIMLRVELGDQLAKGIACAEFVAHGKELPEVRSKAQKEFSDIILRTRTLINALSYDIPLRISAYHVSVLTARIMFNVTRDEPSGDDWAKLQKLRKLCFRIVHKKDHNDVDEMLTLAEIQNIVEIDPKVPDSLQEVDPFDELRKAVKNPELLEKLRRSVRGGKVDGPGGQGAKASS